MRKRLGKMEFHIKSEIPRYNFNLKKKEFQSNDGIPLTERIISFIPKKFVTTIETAFPLSIISKLVCLFTLKYNHGTS